MVTGGRGCIRQFMESEMIAQEIVDDLESALEQFRLIAIRQKRSNKGKPTCEKSIRR